MTLRLTIFFAASLAAAGCNDGASPEDCADLDEAACEASEDCAPIRGAPADEVCAGDYSNWVTLYGGCMDGDVGCGDAETCGLNPATGEEWIFPSTCLPEGWTSCDYCP